MLRYKNRFPIAQQQNYLTHRFTRYYSNHRQEIL